jgi:hypothetical protein
MAKIIPFRRLRTITLPYRRKHRIEIRVIDQYFPEETRWSLQRANQLAAGFSANCGFTDVRARRQRWHEFAVSSRLIGRYARLVEPFVARGQAEVFIDGRALRIAAKRWA